MRLITSRLHVRTPYLIALATLTGVFGSWFILDRLIFPKKANVGEYRITITRDFEAIAYGIETYCEDTREVGPIRFDTRHSLPWWEGYVGELRGIEKGVTYRGTWEAKKPLDARGVFYATADGRPTYRFSIDGARQTVSQTGSR